MSETSGGIDLMEVNENSRYLKFNRLAWQVTGLQIGVKDRDLTAPPGSPSEGDAYIVDGPATGAWTGHENDIAIFIGGVWTFLGPEMAQGNGIWVDDEGVRVQWNPTGSPVGYVIIAGSNSGDAADLTYTPATPADWDGGSDPGNGQEAFDQLAERVKDLEAGGGSSDFVKIGEVVTSGSQSTVTFSSISSSYRNLEIQISGRGSNASTAVELRMRFNGDTGNNYDSVRNNRFATAVYRAASSCVVAEILGSTGPTDAAGSSTINIQNYKGTTFQKSYTGMAVTKVGTASDGDITGTQQVSGFWRNTAAITQIDIFTASGNFVNGSVVSLYGKT